MLLYTCFRFSEVRATLGVASVFVLTNRMRSLEMPPTPYPTHTTTTTTSGFFFGVNLDYLVTEPLKTTRTNIMQLKGLDSVTRSNLYP